MLDYDPLSHPFELPVQKLLVQCVTDRPLFFPPRQGSTPGTSLAGAYGTALWDAVCSCLNTEAGSCNKSSSKEPRCQNPEHCVIPWLYKPYSTVHRRNFARPVLLRSAELENMAPLDAFTLEVTLWGRQAVAAVSAVKETIKKMGELGLSTEGMLVHFIVSDIQEGPVLTLAEQLEHQPPTSSILLEFQTPFLHQEKDEQGKRYFYTQGPLPIISILGNIAYNLVAWDIEDRKVGEQIDGKMRHTLARDARDVAWSAAKNLLIVRNHLSPVKMGERFSRGNQKMMSLQGFIGLVELSGDLPSVWPWLLALTLSGGGQKRAMGFGTVRMWLNSF
jgi:hypothetical protein